MFSICVPAFLKWELHQAVKVWEKNSRLGGEKKKQPAGTCTCAQFYSGLPTVLNSIIMQGRFNAKKVSEPNPLMFYIS